MNRLEAFRYIENLTQEQLAEYIEVSPQLVSAIERGLRTFNGDLSKIGYRNERLILPEMSEPLHRIRASTSVTFRKKAKELIRLGGEVFSELRPTLKGVNRFSCERLESPKSLDDVSQLAEEARYLLNIELYEPIQNLTSSFERAGICLIPLGNQMGIDGMSSWVNETPVIGISQTIPGDRFRFTLCHELAHLLFHRKKSEVSEDEANLFASQLLFPQEYFEMALGDKKTIMLQDFISLKSNWGISIAALIYRSHQFGYITDDRYRALQIQMSKWRRNEPMPIEVMAGQLLSKLIKTNGGYEKVSSNLGINKEHLIEISNWNPLRVLKEVKI